MVIDVHCHIIPNIDDGAGDINISLDMCRIAQEDGTHGIIATPHYIHGTINNTLDLVKEKVEELNKSLREKNIDIDIYPGCEAFICPELPQLVKEGRVCTLNNTQYVLLELPMNSVPAYTQDVLYQLKLDGYTPIIAHPERNRTISKKPDILYDLIGRGALAQVNASSLKGLFGERVMHTAIELVRHNMVHLLASDAHTTGGRSPKLSRAIDVIEREAGEEALLMIMKNSEAVVNNMPVDIGEPIMYEKGSKAGFVGNIKKVVSGFLSF